MCYSISIADLLPHSHFRTILSHLQPEVTHRQVFWTLLYLTRNAKQYLGTLTIISRKITIICLNSFVWQGGTIFATPCRLVDGWSDYALRREIIGQRYIPTHTHTHTHTHIHITIPISYWLTLSLKMGIIRFVVFQVRFVRRFYVRQIDQG